MTATFDSTGAGSKISHDQVGNITGIVALPATTLAIAQISPEKALPGKTVDLYGTAFGSTLSAIAVKFNGSTATATALHRNRLTVTVPSAATTGAVTVTIGSATATYPGFTVTVAPPPTITGLSTSMANIGDPVTITGTGFDIDPTLDVVSVNGTITHASAATATSVTFAAPPTRSFGRVTVATPVGSAATTGDLLSVPSPFAATDVAWEGRVATNGTGSVIAFPSAQKIGLALFDVPAGQRAMVSFTGVTLTHCYEIHVYSPGETVAAHDESVCGSGYFDLPDRTAAGTYQVEIQPETTDTGQVTLAVVSAADLTAGITIGGSAGSLTTTIAGQHAVFTFPGEVGQRVFTKITNVAGATGFADARLVGPQGVVVASSTQGVTGTAGNSSSIDTAVLPVHGTYQVVVDPRDSAVGSYSVALSTVPADVTHTGSIGGAAVSFPLTTLGQNGKLTFTGAAGQKFFTRVALSGFGQTTGCIDLELDNSVGNEQAVAYSCGTAATAHFDDVVLPTAGTYTISIDPEGIQTATVALTLLSVPTDVTVATAADGTARGATVTYGQGADYSFTGAVNQRVFIASSLAGVAADSTTTLKAPDGSTVTTSFNGILATRALTQAGTYTVVVTPDDDKIGATSVTIWSVPVDPVVALTAGGAAGTASMTTPGQGATFTFAATAGQQVIVSCADALVNAGTGDLRLTLLDPSGASLGTDYDCGATSSASFSVQVPTTGNYQVTAELPGVATGTVTLSVAQNGYVTGTLSLDGSQVAVTTTAPGQQAKVTFTTTSANQTVYVVGSTTTIDSANEETTFKLQSSTGTVLDTGYLYRADPATIFDPQTIAAAGTYTIVISPPSSATGTITLRGFNSFVTANAALDGTQVAVTTTIPGQQARVSFTTTAANQTVYVEGSTTTTDAAADETNFALYSATGSRLTTGYVYNTAPKHIISPIVIAVAGTYALQIEPPAGLAGTITLRVFNAFVTATAAVDGTQLAVTTTKLGQKARVSVTTTAANQTVYVEGSTTTTNTAGEYTNFYLNSATGTRIESGYLTNTAPKEILSPVVIATAGTYTLQIEPPAGVAGTITLRVFNAFVTATAALDGTQLALTTTKLGQKARVSFTTTAANQTVYVEGSTTTTDAASDFTYFYVYNSAGTKLTSGYLTNTAPKHIITPVVIATAGTYTLQIEPPPGVAGTITVRVFNSFVSATAALNGATVTVTTTKLGQKARVAFTTTAANQKVYVVGSATTTDAANDFTYFYLYNAAGTKLTSGYVTQAGVKTVINGYAIATAGTYTLQIEPPAGLAGTLTAKVSTTAPARALAPTVRPPADPSPAHAVTPPAVHSPQSTAQTTPDGMQIRHEPATRAVQWPPSTGPPIWSSQPVPPTDSATLTGRVLNTKGAPLADVTVSVDGTHRARTRRDGTFRLTRLPDATRVLRLDGRTADGHGATYGVFDVEVHLHAGSNKLSYTPYLPVLDTAHEISIPSPTTSEVVVTNPAIPGLEVHIPKGVTIVDADGKPAHKVGITAIPVDRTPIPMPQGVQVPVYYTVQPAGGKLVGGAATLTYPNYLHQKPGTPVNFWHYEKHGEGWEVYGGGTVDAAGTQVRPNADTDIEDFDGAMISVPGWLKALLHGLGDALGFAGDPVDLQTGLMQIQQTDLSVNDVDPLQLTRAYNSGDSYQRGVGIGWNDLYDSFLSSENQYQEADLNFVDGSTVHFVRTTPGNSFVNAAFVATNTTTRFAGSTLIWNGAGWNLLLTDGTALVYGENAPLQRIVDPDGNTISVLRTSKNSFGSYIGDITEVRSPNGYWLHYSYDTSDRITQVIDDAGRSVEYTYDTASGKGHLQTVTDVMGGVTRYAYDSHGRLATIIDARGNLALTNTYDTNGRVLTQALASGLSYTFAYTLDAAGSVSATTVSDNTGQVRTTTFDSSGRIATDTVGVGTSLQHTTTIARDATTQLPAIVTDGLGHTVTTGYDATGQDTGDSQGTGTGQLTDAATYHNTPYGLPDTVTDPNLHTTSYTYDDAGHVTSTLDPVHDATSTTYNSQGQVLTNSDGFNQIKLTMTYSHGAADSVTDSMGHTTRYFRDAAGRVVVTTAPDGSTGRIVFDAGNNVVKTIDAHGGVTSFTYDENGNETSVTDARQNAQSTPKSTALSYDSSDRLIAQTDPLGNLEQFGYDPTGRMTTHTDARGQVTSYSYDALGRTSMIGYGRTGTAPNYSYESTLIYTYNAAGLEATVTDSTAGAGAITYTYDAQDRLHTEQTAGGTIGYTYDNVGNVKTVTPSGATQTSYGYDDANRLTSAAQGTLGDATIYDADNRVTSETLPNGVVRTPGYDASGMLTKLSFAKGGSAIGDLDYGYDQLGRVNSVTGTLATLNLPAAESGETYDADNRLAAIGSVTRSYDDAGNLLSDGTHSYTWNARGQLIGTGGAQTSTLTYDPAGRLHSSTVGGTATTFRYSGAQQIGQAQTGGATLSYLLGDSGPLEESGTVIASTDNTGAAHSYLRDDLGSTIALTDGTGAITTGYSYDPFGVVTAPSGDTNPIRYTGQPSGPGLPAGIQDNRARFYSPSDHRFLSQDPIGFNGGTTNLYQYGDGDPADNTDPSGEFVQYVAACVGGAIFTDVVGALIGAKHSFGDYLKGAAEGCAGGLLLAVAPELLPDAWSASVGDSLATMRGRLANGNNFIRIGRITPGTPFRISMGPAPKYYNRLSTVKKIFSPIHIHIEWGKLGVDFNWIGKFIYLKRK